MANVGLRIVIYSGVGKSNMPYVKIYNDISGVIALMTNEGLPHLLPLWWEPLYE